MREFFNAVTVAERIQLEILRTLEEIRDKIENKEAVVETVDKIDNVGTINLVKRPLEEIVNDILIERAVEKIEKFKCEKCGKVCKNKLGLNSHTKACKEV